MEAAFRECFAHGDGCIVFMPSLYLRGTKRCTTTWIIWLAGLLFTWSVWLQAGYIFHVAYARRLTGPWYEFHPVGEKVRSSKFAQAVLFEGEWQPLGKDYVRAYQSD